MKSPVLYEYVNGVWLWAQRIGDELVVGVADDVIVPPKQESE